MKQETPIPQGLYAPARRAGSLVITAGMTPRRKGALIQSGKIQAGQPLERYREAVRQAAANAMAAAKSMAADGEDVRQILSIFCCVNAEDGFSDFSRVADFASEYFCQRLGDAGVGARVCVGVSALPGNAPVELQITALLG